MRDGPLGETIPGAISITLGQLPFKADPTSGFEDSRITKCKASPVLLTCDGGAQAMLAGKLLCEYGYTSVKVRPTQSLLDHRRPPPHAFSRPPRDGRR